MSGATLLDCGHYITSPVERGGVCQFEGCGRQSCSSCQQVCMRCGAAICPLHQEFKENWTQVYCPDCVGRYAVKKVLKALVQPRQRGTRELPAGERDAEAASQDRTPSLWEVLLGGRD